MRVSLAVLREMADLPDDPDAVAAAMNDLGMAVEDIIRISGPIAGVVTARITRCERHPDAAKVTRVWVDAGDGIERHVWCGATNMGPGDVVPLALPGTELPDGRRIERRAILGIESEGMLCAPGEIAVPGDDAGLLILDPGTALGESPHAILGIRSDTIFDLDLTRNRPECWGHAGVARDLAGRFGAEYRGPRIGDIGVRAGGGSDAPDAVLDDEGRCAMFATTIVEGVAVGPSPGWIAARLESLGMRSINNVVDASNLVMLECNQPNHAYDRAVVSGVRVRRARAGEHLVTLDGVDRELDPADLLICNQDDVAVGLAGVMGGEHSEVTDSTRTVLLEVAWFDPDTVRFTANRHGLRSEASARFERGVDPEGVAVAVGRFVTLLAETCPGLTVSPAPSVVRHEACPVAARIVLRSRTVERTLGRAVADAQLRSILGPIGFDVSAAEIPGSWAVTVPTWRPDCTEEVDLVEEVGRHLGYDSLGRRPLQTSQAGRLSETQRRRRILRSALVGLGLDEVMPNPFLAPGDLDRCGLDEGDALRLTNPLAIEESVLRTSLRPGMLGVAVRNLSHRVERVRIWELGRVWPRGTQDLPDEFEQLGILVVGSGVESALEQWLAVSDALGVGAQLDQARIPAGLHPGRSASLTRGKSVLGAVGEIDPAVSEALGIKVPVSWFEANMTVLLGEVPKVPRAKDVSRLPSSDLDLSFHVPDDLAAADLHRALRQAAGSLADEVTLFDVFHDAQGARALAFRIRLQPRDKTLNDEEIAAVRGKCIEAAGKTGARLRGSLD